MRALYIYRDDPDHGLEHGRHYHIRKQVLKSGRVRITVEETKGKVTYNDAFDFARHFQVK